MGRQMKIYSWKEKSSKIAFYIVFLKKSHTTISKHLSFACTIPTPAWLLHKTLCLYSFLWTWFASQCLKSFPVLWMVEH